LSAICSISTIQGRKEKKRKKKMWRFTKIKDEESYESLSGGGPMYW
jgi:hypothetical protein